MQSEPIEAGMIDLRIATLRQLYDEMDPSPLPERDLNPRSEEFIVSWSRELPKNAALRLRISVDRPSGEWGDEATIGESIRHFFAGRSSASRLRLRRLFSNGRSALMIGLGCLALAFALAHLLDTYHPLGEFTGVFRESLVVGGWVAMWRPLEIFLYDWWPIRADERLFDRLSGMPIEIKYQSTE